MGLTHFWGNTSCDYNNQTVIHHWALVNATLCATIWTSHAGSHTQPAAPQRYHCQLTRWALTRPRSPSRTASPPSSPSSSPGCCIWSIRAPGGGKQSSRSEPPTPLQTGAEPQTDHSSMAMNASAWVWSSQTQPATRSENKLSTQADACLAQSASGFLAQLHVSTRWCLHDQWQKWAFFIYSVSGSQTSHPTLEEEKKKFPGAPAPTRPRQIKSKFIFY